MKNICFIINCYTKLDTLATYIDHLLKYNNAQNDNNLFIFLCNSYSEYVFIDKITKNYINLPAKIVQLKNKLLPQPQISEEIFIEINNANFVYFGTLNFMPGSLIDQGISLLSNTNDKAVYSQVNIVKNIYNFYTNTSSKTYLSANLDFENFFYSSIFKSSYIIKKLKDFLNYNKPLESNLLTTYSTFMFLANLLSEDQDIIYLDKTSTITPESIKAWPALNIDALSDPLHIVVTYTFLKNFKLQNNLFISYFNNKDNLITEWPEAIKQEVLTNYKKVITARDTINEYISYILINNLILESIKNTKLYDSILLFSFGELN